MILILAQKYIENHVNHGVGSNDQFREQKLGKIGDFAEQSGRAERS